MKCWGLGFSFGKDFDDFIGDSIDELGDNLPFFKVNDNDNINDNNNDNINTNSLSIKKVASGFGHTCFILDTDNLKCLGYNYYGQTGIGSTKSKIIESLGYIGNQLPEINLGININALDITLGFFHTCVIVTFNKVKCFGINNKGQLGYENTNDLGKYSSDMGDNLKFVNLGNNYEVLSIHSGSTSNHTCAIFSKPVSISQRIKCWGQNDNYQLGYGDNITRGDNINEMGNYLPFIDLGIESRVKQIVLGYWHTCTLIINNILKCFGAGGNGQLGYGTNENIIETGNYIPIINIDTGMIIKMISAGLGHTCIVYNDLITYKCFGYNVFGQLGQGDTIGRGDSLTSTINKIPPINLGTNNLHIKSIYSGSTFNCVLFVDSSIKCFGDGKYGQLGIGSQINIGDEPNEMGENLKFVNLTTFKNTNQTTDIDTDINTDINIIIGIVIGVIFFILICIYVYKRNKTHKTTTNHERNIRTNITTNIERNITILESNTRANVENNISIPSSNQQGNQNNSITNLQQNYSSNIIPSNQSNQQDIPIAQIINGNNISLDHQQNNIPSAQIVENNNQINDRDQEQVRERERDQGQRQGQVNFIVAII